MEKPLDADAPAGETHMDAATLTLPPIDTRPVARLDPVGDAMLTDIAMLSLRGSMKRKDIAEEMGITPRHLQRLVQKPEFIEIYERLKHEIYGEVSRVVVDEKADIMVRAQAQAIRAQTLLAETTELLRGRIHEETSGGQQMSSMALRVAVDAAKVAIQYSPAQRSSSDGTKVQVNVFQPNTSQAKTLKEAVGESGIDMDDLLAYFPQKRVIEDAEIIEDTPDDGIRGDIPDGRHPDESDEDETTLAPVESADVEDVERAPGANRVTVGDNEASGQSEATQ